MLEAQTTVEADEVKAAEQRDIEELERQADVIEARPSPPLLGQQAMVGWVPGTLGVTDGLARCQRTRLRCISPTRRKPHDDCYPLLQVLLTAHTRPG